jgi:hypothetical protein
VHYLFMELGEAQLEGDEDERKVLLNSSGQRSSSANSNIPAISIYNLNAIGVVMLLFAIYGLRFVYLPQSWRGEGLKVFYPVISPVYRQGEHWQGVKETMSIIAHVSFGAVMLTTGVLQFDKQLRNRYPAMHKWSGRIYIACGAVCVFALYGLSDSFGAGSAHLPGSRSELLAVFVHLSAALWTASTSVALYAVLVSRNFALHRDAMSASIAVGGIPILQRLASVFILTPISMMLRAWLCTTRDRMPWRTKWGMPGGTSSLLFGACDACSAEHNPGGVEDPRACPLVFSLDGYGEGELASFPASAWVGFLIVCVTVLPQLKRHFVGGESTSSPAHMDYGNSVANINSFDLLRNQGEYFSEQITTWARFIEGQLQLCRQNSAPDAVPSAAARGVVTTALIAVVPLFALATAVVLSIAIYVNTLAAVFLVSVVVSPFIMLAVSFNFSLIKS